jgi:MHS family proline/betaine transporter-like MFS transporter
VFELSVRMSETGYFVMRVRAASDSTRRQAARNFDLNFTGCAMSSISVNPCLEVATCAAPNASQRRQAIIATTIGNGLEWFDFTVYTAFAVIIAKLFFPMDNPLSSLLLTVGVYGAAFVMRPIGAMVFGIYADRVGRKQALSLSVLMMAFGTALIGLAPSYLSAGMLGPIMLVFARLLQGFSAGGEMGSASAFLIEYAPAGRRAFYTSWIQSSIALNIVLGALMGAFATILLTHDQLYSWGWRVPFLFGIVVGPVGFYIRTRIDVSPVAAHMTERSSSPLTEVFQEFRLQTLASFALVALWTTCTYVYMHYMPTYVVTALHQSQKLAFISVTVGGFVFMVLSPLVGILSDRWGHRRFLMISAAAIFLTAYPMFAYISRTPTLLSLTVFSVVAGVLSACYSGPLLAALAELFPSRVLSTGISVSYNLAVTVFGGFAGFFITLLISMTHSALSPAFYMMVAAAMSFAGSFAVKS